MFYFKLLNQTITTTLSNTLKYFTKSYLNKTCSFYTSVLCLFAWRKKKMCFLQTLEICLSVDPLKETDNSPDRESPATGNTVGNVESKTSDFNHPLKIKTGLQKRAAGFQATLICLTTAPSGEQPENITSLSLNSSYGL